jgi:Chaperone of endosialidase
MNDQWVPGPPPAPPQWTNAPLPPSNDWNAVSGCCPPGGPSIVDGIVITGRPATISAMPWTIVLNDGGSPPNFSINHYDSSGNLIDSSMVISGVDGSITFNDPVLLSRDPVEPMEAATKEYVDNIPSGGVPEAPQDNYSYARYMATWERLPQAYIPEAPNTSQRFGRFNSTWQLDAIQTDAPNDGGTYGRQNNAWNPALAISGGTITGSLTVNQVLTVQGSNSLVLNAPVTGGNQRAILSMAANVARWQLALGDGTAEGAGNAGANFTLAAYGVTGAFLGNWLTIARADGSAVFNGSGVTIQSGLAVNGTLALASPNNLAIYGGSAGQFLSTNGSGILSWATPAGGGIADAPADGTTYARNNAAWAHLAHTDITDWAAELANYYPTTNPSGYQTAAQVTAVLPIASNNAPLMNGTAAAGLLGTWSRADHVHPSDTSRYAASNPSGYQTAAQVAAALPVASTTNPLMNGAVAIGVGTTWARADHVHPSDTSRLPLTGGTLTGQLNGTNATFSGALSNTAGSVNVAGGTLPSLGIYTTTAFTTLAAQFFWRSSDSAAGIYHFASGATALIDTSGNFNVSGATAYKPGGGSWTAPSDARIKRIVGDYQPGLDEVLRIRPIDFVYLGNDTPTADVNDSMRTADAPKPHVDVPPYPASPHYQVAIDERPFVGFVAQELEQVFPAMVTARPGFIDGEAVTDLRDVDTSSLIFALVNAVKDLKAEIDALKQQVTPHG